MSDTGESHELTLGKHPDVGTLSKEKEKMEAQLSEATKSVDRLKKVLDVLMSETSSVHISARIRPFSPSELAAGGRPALSVDHRTNTTTLHETRSGRAINVTFDEVLDSSGDPVEPMYASQQRVYDRVGRPLLDFAFQGFNVTLLVFGQTASGKTYTMVGDNVDRGIVPRFISEMFERIEAQKQHSSNVVWDVEFEAVEIYSEQIYNLLEGCVCEDGLVSPVPRAVRHVQPASYRLNSGTFDDISRQTRARSRTPPAAARGRRFGSTPGAGTQSPRSCSGSTVRSSSNSSGTHSQPPSPRRKGSSVTKLEASKYLVKGGVHVPYYVQGLQPVKITDVNKTFNLLAITEQAKTYAETRMNRQSSRAHTLYRIHMTRTEGNKTLTSTVSLVDLAGSENLKSSGAEGVTAAEAISINKSLTVLAHCLTLRAKNSSITPPYNTCVLTKLLKETLDGNARTHMVINLAPTDFCASASAAALRFAKMCKQVRIRPRCNLAADDEPYNVQIQRSIDQLKIQLEQEEGSNQEMKDKIDELQGYINEQKRRKECAVGPSKLALRKFMTAQERTLLQIEQAYFADEQRFCDGNGNEAEHGDAKSYYKKLSREEDKKANELKRKIDDDYYLELVDPQSEDDEEVFNMLSDVFQWSCTNQASEFVLYKLELSVVKIERLVNPRLKSQFYRCKAGLKGPHMPSVLRFFGGKCDDITPVLRSGFSLPDPKKFNTYGGGLPFATNATKTALSTSEMQNQLLVCEVGLGNLMPTDHALPHGFHALTPKWVHGQGFDSVFASRGTTLMEDEYIIFKDKQAVPVYVITYVIKRPQDDDKKKLKNLERINHALEEKISHQSKELTDAKEQISVLLKHLPSSDDRISTGCGTMTPLPSVDQPESTAKESQCEPSNTVPAAVSTSTQSTVTNGTMHDMGCDPIKEPRMPPKEMATDTHGLPVDKKKRRNCILM